MLRGPRGHGGAWRDPGRGRGSSQHGEHQRKEAGVGSRVVLICLLQEGNKAESLAGPPCLCQREGTKRKTDPSASQHHNWQRCAKGQTLGLALGMAKGPQTLALVMEVIEGKFVWEGESGSRCSESFWGQRPFLLPWPVQLGGGRVKCMMTQQHAHTRGSQSKEAGSCPPGVLKSSRVRRC